MAVSWKTPKVSLPRTIVQKGIMPYLRPGGREQQEWIDIHLRAARRCMSSHSCCSLPPGLKYGMIPFCTIVWGRETFGIFHETATLLALATSLE